MALGTAFRAFFAALFNREVADRLDRALQGESDAEPAKLAGPTPEPPSAAPKSLPKSAARSEAITLLATLQREARLIDLVQENLSAYNDAQIGAAARPCLTQCAAVLERMMSIQPIASESEGAMIEVASSAGPSRYQWIGEGSGSNGKLVHHGWIVDHIELPRWTGTEEDANVIAPVQVQRS